MQSVTVCPFRVVDEINQVRCQAVLGHWLIIWQLLLRPGPSSMLPALVPAMQGMDVINERKVFELLSAAAGKAGTPQCFLLTPKLLPALPFSGDCSVLQVVCGPHMQLPLPYAKVRLPEGT